MLSLKSELQSVSKHKINIIAEKSIKEAGLLAELMEVALSDEDPVCWHASWVVNHIGRKNSLTLIPYVATITEKIRVSENESQIGSLLRALSETDFELDENAGLIDICFSFLEQDRPLFIKAYSMLLIRKIVKLEPALARETILVLEKCMPFLGSDYLEKKAKELIRYINKMGFASQR